MYILGLKFFFHFLPNRFQFFIEIFYGLIYRLVYDNIGSKGQKFFPYIFTLFLFLFLANISGLVSYSFTITSHLIVAFSFAFVIFISITLICFKNHELSFFFLFLPAGSSLFLAFLLIPIELISYLFRPISLSVRLFANMMAGHTLLKVIVGFAWSMLLAGGSATFAHFFPLVILIFLMFLELGVAIIQSYVFTILICVYLNDALNLH